MDALLVTAVILGLTSSLHCMGMCGPISMAIPVNRNSNLSILWGIVQYNFGRILSYSMLGVLVGSIGITLETVGFLQVISIVSGIVMVLYAWNKQLSSFFHLPSFGGGIQSLFNKAFGQTLKQQHFLRLSFLGFLNGLLPCGMVYLALMNVLLLGSPLKGAFGMTLFGLGTLPAMLFVGFAAMKISRTSQPIFAKAVPYLLTIVGTLIILRGMNLNIPYVSPKINLIAQDNTQEASSSGTKPQVEMSCCHGGSKTTCSPK